MGCGRSTLGSDSPKKNKKKAVEAEISSDDNSSNTNSSSSSRKHQRSQNQQMINKLSPVGGGPLRAQAKISSSQQNFFMMLDQKIENGPDYESEEEEVDRYRRLHEYAEQWQLLTRARPLTPPTPPTPPMRYPGDDTCGSGDITEDDEEDDGLSEPECIPDEAVREQYMFMGNLYTLTHIRTDDDTTEPKVDIVTPAKTEKHVEEGHKFNGSAVPDEFETTGDVGENNESGDSKQTQRAVSRPSSRPASLILRSVFPTESAHE